MTFDFSQLRLPTTAKAPTDPFEIFANLPRLTDNAPNDLWRGQAEALTQWNIDREKNDVLISLNTGAGKTLVGLLVAKSLCNEGVENVIYVCPTIDLVHQTAKQARAFGIEVTTRIASKFDNDLFEIGKTFCITTYHTIFNGLSGIRRKYFPGAMVFDDAHVAESLMRDAFSMKLSPSKHQVAIAKLFETFLPDLRTLNREGEYRDAFDVTRSISSVMIPPDVVARNSAQLEGIIGSFGADNDAELKYSYAHLRGHLSICAIVVRGGGVEISPPFLPSLGLDVFAQRLRRVYLSATLHNKADIVRAFGRIPEIIIEPSNDAGNGERLILTERPLTGSTRIDPNFVQDLKQEHKVLVAVPDYRTAALWANVATPPSRENFSAELDTFRQTDSPTGFILVNRVDGIDLPHKTCRLMVMEGVPRSEGLLERYQFEYLQMRTFAASRIANRLVQLFGRINRGRSDYGAFLISGRDLNTWIANDKHVALLPDLLKKQILLGRQVQEDMQVKTLQKIKELLRAVILSQPRDQNWTSYYSNFIQALDVSQEKTDRAALTEKRNLEAAKAEAVYGKSAWDRDFISARAALDSIVAETARADEKLAGWHNLWIGATYDQQGDPQQARLYYAQAKGQLGINLIVSANTLADAGGAPQPLNRAALRLSALTNLSRESFTKQSLRMGIDLAPLANGTPSQTEEATRYLGEMLGFEASRPDNDVGTGPDVLWLDPTDQTMLGIELKTDKKEGSSYSKDDVAQSLDHLSWMANEHPDCRSLGVVLVGPAKGHMDQANPTDQIYAQSTDILRDLATRLNSLVRDAYELLPLERSAFLDERTADLSLSTLASRLLVRRLKDD